MKKLLPYDLAIVFLLSGAGCAPLAGEGFFYLKIPGPSAPGLIVRTEEIILGMLLLAAAVSWVSQRLRIPYTIGLVLVGFGLSLLVRVPVFSLTPEIILALLVPPLVFEAAFHLNFAELRRELPLILLLAVPGVILTTLLVGGLVSYAAGLSLSSALVFGALIAATDPVAVVALFRSIGAPRRLQILLEGESLLNDGTAIVLFNIMLMVALTGQFNFVSGLLQFVLVAGGGILLGAVAGVIVSRIISRIDDYLLETTLTTLLAYGAYLIAEEVLGVSGVLAVVAAGLAAGALGPRGMSPTTRIVVSNFWDYAAFLANSFVFLLIGLQIDWRLLVENAAAIGWGILAVLLARVITVYGLSLLSRRIPFQWKNILFWGGLRGAISLALALSLSASLPTRVQIQSMAFGVVLFTLVVEGLSMKALVQRSGLVQKSVRAGEYERQNARAIALRASQARMKQLYRDGLVSDFTWRRIKPVLDVQSQELARSLHALLEDDPSLHQAELGDAWREALRTQRSTLTALLHDGIVSEETYTGLVAEVDSLLISPDDELPGGIPPSAPPLASEVFED